MRQIWKYPIEPARKIVVPGDPSHPVVLVAPDPGNAAPVALWVEHQLEESPDPNVSYKPVGNHERVFTCCGTGWQIPDGWTHRGSCVSGDEVWHVYEWRA